MSQQLLLKVCGMREADNIREVATEVHPSWMGFICWPVSKRYVFATTPEPPAFMPPPTVARVGVFVDQTLAEIRQCQSTLGLNLVQLHGHETPAFCQEVRQELQLPVVRAISISTQADILASAAYDGSADYLLFDTHTPLRGGSGTQWDWQLLKHYEGPTPFLLSGGIGPDDALRLRSFHHPLCIGIDVNSRFETAPGVKDAAALRAFWSSICQAEELPS